MPGEEVADLLGRLCLLAAVPDAGRLQEANKHHADLLAALELGRLDAAVGGEGASGRVGCRGVSATPDREVREPGPASYAGPQC